jgi:translation initiation factor 2 beta subunit (eIF-2beta)/eIF-5
MTFDIEQIRGTDLESVLKMFHNYCVLQGKPLTEVLELEETKLLIEKVGVKKTTFRSIVYFMARLGNMKTSIGVSRFSNAKKYTKDIKEKYKELMLSGMKTESAIATLMLEYQACYSTIKNCLKREEKDLSE